MLEKAGEAALHYLAGDACLSHVLVSFWSSFFNLQFSWEDQD